MIRVLDDFKDRSVCIMGCGYVGLTLAAAMADVGFEVLGVEIRDDVLKNLQQGIPHFHEPGLEETLTRLIKSKKIRFEKTIPTDWSGSVYIITVGTPLGSEKQVRMDMIENVTQEVTKHLKPNDLVVMRSTVALGTTKKAVRPILNRSGYPYDLAFCPERTLEGQALKELYELPQIVGGITENSTIRASQIFQYLTPTVIRVTDAETAEMIKLVDNTQRDVSFAYANEVARICDGISISAREVIQAGKLGYSRTNLPLPGPVGGPCLEKDPYILAKGTASKDIEPEIVLSARRVNERQPLEVVSALAKIMGQYGNFPQSPVITLLGIAFKGKPETDDLRGTMARPVFDALKKYFPKANFRGFDPIVSKEMIEEFGLSYCSSLENTFKNSNLVVILNNHHLFESMPLSELSRLMAGPGLIYDFWHLYYGKQLHLPDSVGYMALGSHGHAKLPVMEA